MPINAYACDTCLHTFEELVGTFQHYPEPTACPVCQGAIRKQLSSFVTRPSAFTGGEDEREAMKNKKWLESVAGEIREGKREMHVPKGFPARLQPKI